MHFKDYLKKYHKVDLIVGGISTIGIFYIFLYIDYILEKDINEKKPLLNKK